jgi:hypothetical protein
MKINLTLDVSIPVHANTLTVHNDAKYNLGYYYEGHLNETLEDMVKAFLTEKMHSIVAKAASEAEEWTKETLEDIDHNKNLYDKSLELS